MTTRARGGRAARRAALALLGLASLCLCGTSRAAPPRKKAPSAPAKPSPTPASPGGGAAPSAAESPGEQIYRMGREALGRGAFEVAARLFTALDGETRWESDPAYAFNRAQACRYGNRPGEAVFWYGRYLSLAPGAPDAAHVAEQVAKLQATAPGAVRSAAYQQLSQEWERQRAEPELGRTLDEMPMVNLLVRFRRREGEQPEATSYAFPGRAVYWKAPAETTPEATWRVWVVPTTPILAPEGLGAPPLLGLPAGRPIRVELGADLSSIPLVRVGEAIPGLPASPDVATWQVEITAEVRGMGPPLFLVGIGSTQSVEVRSGPREGTLALGKKRSSLPVVATPLVFGPRPGRPDGKLFPRVLLAVFDSTDHEGQVTRWAAPLSALDVVNRFGRLVEKAGEPARIYVRNEETGPSLLSLP